MLLSKEKLTMYVQRDEESKKGGLEDEKNNPMRCEKAPESLPLLRQMLMLMEAPEKRLAYRKGHR